MTWYEYWAGRASTLLPHKTVNRQLDWQPFGVSSQQLPGGAFPARSGLWRLAPKADVLGSACDNKRHSCSEEANSPPLVSTTMATNLHFAVYLSLAAT